VSKFYASMLPVLFIQGIQALTKPMGVGAVAARADAPAN
jgi:hypothetical protein